MVQEVLSVTTQAVPKYMPARQRQMWVIIIAKMSEVYVQELRLWLLAIMPVGS